jgi:pimeloyl-ACP methyl ester carboxylesterase
MLRTVGKWIIKILAAFVCLALAILIILRTSTFFRENKSPKDAAPAGGYYVSGGDIKIYVQETGPKNGVSIVFIHGFGAWSETWRKTLDALAAEGFHSYALDLPPFGFSEKVTNEDFSRTSQARRIIKVLDNLNLKQVILVGHSVGGRPTIEVALMAPDRIKTLVLVDAALSFGANGEFEQNHPAWWLKTFFAIRPLRNAILATAVTNPLMSKKLLGSFVADQKILTKSLLHVYQQPFAVKDSTNRLGDWLKVLSLDKDNSMSSNFSNFSKLNMPALLIWGDKDTITPLWQGEKLQKLIPHASLSVLSGLGHIPQIENPDQFNQVLLSFLQKHKN